MRLFFHYWKEFLPFLSWPRPTFDSLRKDTWAGISVGLVVIPQSLAYATLADMPPVTGLYAALLPCVIGVLWGGSPLLVTGPVALTSLLTFAALQPLAAPTSGDWVALAIWLAIYAGAIQILLGTLRLGAITNFIAYPVMAGFINAAALIIIVSQLPALLGLPTKIDASWWYRANNLWQEAPESILANAAFGVLTLLALLLLKRFVPRVPGVLLITVAAIVLSASVGSIISDLAIVGAIPRGLPDFGQLPSLGIAQHRALLPAALVIALISFTEAMSSCKTLARQSGQQWNVDQELIGQGLAKIASGASGAFPVSGSFSRSALNAYAGAVGGWSSLFAAGCVVTCLLWFTGYLYHLPRAVLAAIIIVPTLQLIDVGIFRQLWQISRDDGGVALTTFGATLLSVPHSHWGVFAGFVASLLCFLYRRAHPRVIEVSVHSDGTLRDRSVHRLPPLAPDVLAVRMDAAITYITAPVLERFIVDHVRSLAGIRTVLLCSSPANDIDATGVEMLQQLHRRLVDQEIRLLLSGVKKQVRETLERAGVTEQLGTAAFFSTDREAIETLAVGRRDDIK